MMLIYWEEATCLKNPETLVVDSNEMGLEENADKITYMVMSRV